MMIFVIVLEKVVVDVEDEEELLDARVSDDEVLGQHWLLLIQMQLLHLDLEPELLRQICCFHEEVPLSEVVDSSTVVTWLEHG